MTKRKDGRVQNQKTSHKKYGILKELCKNKSVNIFFAGTVHAEDDTTATLLGMRTRAYKFQPVADIKKITNFDLRSLFFLSTYVSCHPILFLLTF